MKKNILFIISNMESGGFQKSLLSLLQCFDYSRYNVDLLVLNPNGIFMSSIPNEVNILDINTSKYFFESFPKSCIDLIKTKNILLAYKRLIQFIISRLDKGKAALYMSRQIDELENEYDVAVDYNGQQILYYMVDKIKAKKKISYFHSDYKKWDYYKVADKKYYPKVDYIVTISDICKKSLDDVFPECANKTRVIYNISSPKVINKLAAEECEINFDKNYTNIVMLGRPYYVKGYDFAIEACYKLKKNGFKVRFYSIGVSNEMGKYKKLVKKFGVNDQFIFLGEKSNPYKFIRQSDIYIHPSRFEGKSIAIDEAKILCKPIIITNFSTANDHITDGVNGIIVEMNSEELFQGIKKMIEDKHLKYKLVNNLKSENIGNEDEVLKLYNLID